MQYVFRREVSVGAVLFSNQQIFSSPVAAIQVLERQQSRIVMTECETEEVSCVKVAEATRDIDRENYHFT